MGPSKFLGVGVMILSLAGCNNSEPERSTDKTSATPPPAEEVTMPDSIPVLQAPPSQATPETEPEDLVTTASVYTESQSTATAVSPTAAEAAVTAQPSAYPVEMAVTVELRKKLEAIDPAIGHLKKDQVQEILNYTRSIQTLTETKNTLSKEQRSGLEEYVGKVEYQALEVQEGTENPPFEGRFKGIKSYLAEIQKLLTETPVQQ